MDVGGGDQLVLDLATGTVTDIGVPDPIQPGNVPFTNTVILAVNDSSELVVAANLASLPAENHLTYLHRPTLGYGQLDPTELPTRFVGFYDNNDRGDVSSSGGVLFTAEGTLLPGYDQILEPGSISWDLAIGFIADDRTVYTTAVDTATGDKALVVLRPAGVLCTDGFETGGTQLWSSGVS